MFDFPTLDEQVRQEAFKEGEKHKSIEIAKKMLKDNWPFEKIQKYLPKLSLSELKELQKKIL